jgi:hypothetical protein
VTRRRQAVQVPSGSVRQARKMSERISYESR